MPRSLSINVYVIPCSFAINGKLYLYYYAFSDFFWSVNYANVNYELCITFGKCQNAQTLFILESF